MNRARLQRLLDYPAVACEGNDRVLPEYFPRSGSRFSTSAPPPGDVKSSALSRWIDARFSDYSHSTELIDVSRCAMINQKLSRLRGEASGGEQSGLIRRSAGRGEGGRERGSRIAKEILASDQIFVGRIARHPVQLFLARSILAAKSRRVGCCDLTRDFFRLARCAALRAMT